MFYFVHVDRMSKLLAVDGSIVLLSLRGERRAYRQNQRERTDSASQRPCACVVVCAREFEGGWREHFGSV